MEVTVSYLWTLNHTDPSPVLVQDPYIQPSLAAPTTDAAVWSLFLSRVYLEGCKDTGHVWNTGKNSL